MAFLSARLKKVEAQRSKSGVRSNVVEIDPTTGKPIGRIPPARRVMVATNFGTDAQWQIALARNQAQLMQRP